jgi:hypothetical protein
MYTLTIDFLKTQGGNNKIAMIIAATFWRYTFYVDGLIFPMHWCGTYIHFFHLTGWRDWGLERSEGISRSKCLQRTRSPLLFSLWVGKNVPLVYFYLSLFEKWICLWHLGHSSVSSPS